MFHVDRWAAVFVNTLGDNAGAGLDCLRAMVPAVKNIPALFGLTAGRRLEKVLRESAADFPAEAGAPSGAGAPAGALEYTIRFITLLVEKKFFGNIDRVLEKIEKNLDERKGILEVIAETASLPDEAFKEERKQLIARQLGVAGVKMKWKFVPELLGGYRLRIGGFYVDASLKGLAEKMTADLAATLGTLRSAAPAPGA
jgi:F-type H+-transporting ATPase subunit delta